MAKIKKTTTVVTTEIIEEKGVSTARILLDRSASMRNHWAETIGSLNAYFSKLAETAPEMFFYVAVFDDTSYDVIRNNVVAKAFLPILETEVLPRGYTPLYDAVVRFVADANAVPNAGRMSIVILTDGQENRSREATREMAKQALDGCRAKEWDIVMLGADFENMTQAASLGNAYATTLKMNKGKYFGVMEEMALRTMSYAHGGLAANSAMSDTLRDKAR